MVMRTCIPLLSLSGPFLATGIPAAKAADHVKYDTTNIC